MDRGGVHRTGSLQVDEDTHNPTASGHSYHKIHTSHMSHFKNAAKTNATYYTKSPYDYAIKIQMLTRGNALPTNLRIERIFPDTGHWGPFCPDCGEVESEHHI